MKDTAFIKRIECFLDRVEKRGLDWTKCLRKLKRRCCDLLRSEKNLLGRSDFGMKSIPPHSDYLSLISSIAKQDLSELQAKQECQLHSMIEKDSVESTLSSS